MLPNRAVAGLGIVSVSNNDFEGKPNVDVILCHFASPLAIAISESVSLERCNTVITESTGGLPRPQLAGRANSTALAWKQRAGPTNR
eukprot:2458358-Amphidinium_carterae.1